MRDRTRAVTPAPDDSRPVQVAQPAARADTGCAGVERLPSSSEQARTSQQQATTAADAASDSAAPSRRSSASQICAPDRSHVGGEGAAGGRLPGRLCCTLQEGGGCERQERPIRSAAVRGPVLRAGRCVSKARQVAAVAAAAAARCRCRCCCCPRRPLLLMLLGAAATTAARSRRRRHPRGAGAVRRRQPGAAGADILPWRLRQGLHRHAGSAGSSSQGARRQQQQQVPALPGQGWPGEAVQQLRRACMHACIRQPRRSSRSLTCLPLRCRRSACCTPRSFLAAAPAGGAQCGVH